MVMRESLSARSFLDPGIYSVHRPIGGVIDIDVRTKASALPSGVDDAALRVHERADLLSVWILIIG